MIFPPANAVVQDCPKCHGKETVWARTVTVVGLAYSYKAWCCAELNCDYEKRVEHTHPKETRDGNCLACDL